MDVKLKLKDAIIRGTVIVRKADGTIRYDKDAVPGDYHESEEDMKRFRDGDNARNSSQG